MRVLSLPIVIALSVLGCDTGTPVAPTRGVSDEVDTTPPPATPPGPTVARPAFKVMTYNVQLANVGASNPASRKPMIVEIIRSEAPDIVGLQELGSTHRADIEAGLQDLYASIPDTVLNSLGMGYVALSFAVIMLVQYSRSPTASTRPWTGTCWPFSRRCSSSST